MPTQHRILSLVYNEFEALDLFGPLGAIVPRSDYYTLELVNLHNLDSPRGLETSIKNGIGVIPTLSLAEALQDDRQFDTLFIPGGFGMMPLVWDPILLQRIGQLVDRAPNVFTVCTGSILLAATGRLNGRKATTNKRLYDEVTPKHPGVQWQKRARWVQDGKFLTSSGVTAGIDAGFAFLANTYVAPEDRQAHPEAQKASAKGDETPIPGFNKEKAMGHAHFTAFGLEYRWHSDPEDDPFVDLPGTNGSA
ncbi:hypothetical protein POX_c04723 [Penicillium oxalicum]|uniref:DJ-1/PfpI domain-containing protein n=1 Tax=Penicillium oxalicum (strain 114-2 / CGMCC 5302) TaxID=933388 RepID=S7Z6S2_PENO1|nr:hypothetical protein POX_c04723 [Penicillium oxalicum]EPS26255.1 hypothetical protein PDE_01191 [Penicillium oxalicum 114-2]KAI2791844.1 hypothetical protein POX_c04723 [Penicillium oxalicum]